MEVHIYIYTHMSMIREHGPLTRSWVSPFTLMTIEHAMSYTYDGGQLQRHIKDVENLFSVDMYYILGRHRRRRRHREYTACTVYWREPLGCALLCDFGERRCGYRGTAADLIPGWLFL